MRDDPVEPSAARWLQAYSGFATALLEASMGDFPENGLDVFLAHAVKAGDASSGAVFLTSPGGMWVCEAVVGEPQVDGGPPIRIGSSVTDILPGFPAKHVPLGVGDSGGPNLTDSLPFTDSATSPHCVCVPIPSESGPQGCLLLGRDTEVPFTEDELKSAEGFAGQAGLALLVMNLLQAREAASQLEERGRIGRDLHDLAIQDLFALGMRLQRLRQEVAGGFSPRLIDQELKGTLADLEQSVHQIRQIVDGLHEEPGNLGLAGALSVEASAARGPLGFAPSLRISLDGEDLAPRTDDGSVQEDALASRVNSHLVADLVAVLREALTNVARHAHARSASVHVSVEGTGPAGHVEMMIMDDGRGVDPSRTRNSGLANMHRRAISHGGTFAVGAGPRGRGTSLVWRAPLG